MADEGGSPFGGGFLDDLGALLSGGGSGGSDGPTGGTSSAAQTASASASAASDDFKARLRGFEDIVNGLA